MSTTAPNTENQEQINSWQLLLSSNLSQLDSLHKRGSEGKGNEESLESNEAERFVDYCLAALSPTPERALSKDSDIEVMKHACSSLLEIMKEGILTESEASALTEFLVSRFIDRRFVSTMQDTFDVELSRRCSFRAIRECPR